MAIPMLKPIVTKYCSLYDNPGNDRVSVRAPPLKNPKMMANIQNGRNHLLRAGLPCTRSNAGNNTKNNTAKEAK